MPRKPEVLAVVLLGATSTALLLGSVFLAFRQAPPGAIFLGKAELPESLFESEPEDDFAPIEEQIATDVTPSPSPAPSPSPSPVASKGGGVPVPKPSPSFMPRLRMRIEFASEVPEVGQRARIKYTAKVSNEGEAPLSELRITSHVPPGTSWIQGGCEKELREIELAFAGGTPKKVCASPSSDPSGHVVDLTLSEALEVGKSVSLSFEVKIEDSSRNQYTSHAHASSRGLTADSGDVVTEVRP